VAVKANANLSAKTLLRHPACLLAFGLGVGLLPKAPGTFGTLLGIPIYWVSCGYSAGAYGLLIGLLFGVGVALCASCERRLRMNDHPGIVWDEIVGFLITMWSVPPTWQSVGVGFLLFRLFDITKPWPISLADRRVKGGFGIMLDDALAGGFAWLALQLIQPYLPT
jgi:phosphatidylglycerophosphatase A